MRTTTPYILSMPPRTAHSLPSNVTPLRDDAHRLAALIARAGQAELDARDARDEARRCWVEAGLILLAHRGERGFRARAGLSERQSETARAYARAWESSGRPMRCGAIAVPTSWDSMNDKEVQKFGRLAIPPGGDVAYGDAVRLLGDRLPALGPDAGLVVAGGRARLRYGVDVLDGLGALPDNSVDMVGTSFPWPTPTVDYGDPRQYGREATADESIARIGPVSRELHRVLQDGGSVWMEYGDAEGERGPMFLDARAAEAFRAAAPWVLAQRCTKLVSNPRPVTGLGPLVSASTSVFLFQKLGTKAYFDPLGLALPPAPKTVVSRTREGWSEADARAIGSVASNVFVCSRTTPHAMPHPAPYATKLPDAWIRLSCPPGGVVLDPFSGAASTGMAALALGRTYVGIDVQLDYLGLAVRNLESVPRTE